METAIAMVRPHREEFAAFVKTPHPDDLDLHEASAPMVHALGRWKIDVDGLRSDEGAAIVIDDKETVAAFDCELRSKGKPRPVGVCNGPDEVTRMRTG
jgi:hypothetical protein